MTEPNPPVGRTVVIMPTYNERQNLESITGRVRAALPEADLLIVDDNSPDGTGDIADKLAEADSHVQGLHRTEKAGLGKAYMAGFAWALERGYDVIVEMDADGSHQPEHLPSLVGALDHADLSIGSRWVRGGKVVNLAAVHSRRIIPTGTGHFRLSISSAIFTTSARGIFRRTCLSPRRGTFSSTPASRIPCR